MLTETKDMGTVMVAEDTGKDNRNQVMDIAMAIITVMKNPRNMDTATTMAMQSQTLKIKSLPMTLRKLS